MEFILFIVILLEIVGTYISIPFFLGKINLNAYTDFFSWFEDTMTDLISDFIPVRAKFLGVNNVIESHILERNKNKYVYDKMYAVNEYDDVGYFSNGADLGLKTIESE